MTTFGVGDRVRTISETWGEDTVPVGAVGTVIKAAPLAVAFDHDRVGDGTGVWAIEPYQLQFVAGTPHQQALLRQLDGAAALFLFSLSPYASCWLTETA